MNSGLGKVREGIAWHLLLLSIVLEYSSSSRLPYYWAVRVQEYSTCGLVPWLGDCDCDGDCNCNLYLGVGVWIYMVMVELLLLLLLMFVVCFVCFVCMGVYMVVCACTCVPVSLGVSLR